MIEKSHFPIFKFTKQQKILLNILRWFESAKAEIGTCPFFTKQRNEGQGTAL